ncbi:hypothetical protein SMQ_00555 [Enterococcus faecium EnGen0183]|nr:hypothetical protein SMQ_00555 [Enterococcus faecium EnGen0183]
MQKQVYHNLSSTYDREAITLHNPSRDKDLAAKYPFAQIASSKGAVALKVQNYDNTVIAYIFGTGLIHHKWVTLGAGSEVR